MSASKQNHIIKLMIEIAKQRGQVLTAGQVGERLNKMKRRLGV